MVNSFDDRFDLVEPYCALDDGVWYRARSQAGTPLEVAIFSHPRDETKERLGVLSKTRHPHLAELLEVVDLEEGRLAAVFAATPGPSIADRLQAKDGTVKEAIDWGYRIAEALAALHRADLVHGDVEPGWIRLVPGRGPVLTGLELNRRTGRENAQGKGIAETMPYAPPEQVRGEPITAASDLYSLAAVLFHALTGTPPLGNGAADAIRERILGEKSPALARLRGDLRGVLGYAVDRALSADGKRRFPDAEAFRKALRSALVVAPRLGVLPLGTTSPSPSAPPATLPGRPNLTSKPPPVPPATGVSSEEKPAEERAKRTSDTRELSESDLEPISASHPLVQESSRRIDALDGPDAPPVGPTSISPPDLSAEADTDGDIDSEATQVDGEQKPPAWDEPTEEGATPKFQTEPAPPLFADPGAEGAEPDLSAVGRDTGDYAAREPRERRGTASWRPAAASASREAATRPRAVVGTSPEASSPEEGELPREPTLRMVYGTDGVEPLAPKSAVTTPAVVGEKAFAHLQTLPLAKEINSPPNAKDPRQEPVTEAAPTAQDEEPETTEDVGRDTTPSDEPPLPAPPSPPEITAPATNAMTPPPSARLEDVSVPTLRIPRKPKPFPVALFAGTLILAAGLFGAGVGVGTMRARRSEARPAEVSSLTEGSAVPTTPVRSPEPARQSPPASAVPIEVPEPVEATRPAVLTLEGVPDGAAITVDGTPVDGTAIPIEGERHTVEIRSEGHEPWRTEVGRGRRRNPRREAPGHADPSARSSPRRDSHRPATPRESNYDRCRNPADPSQTTRPPPAARTNDHAPTGSGTRPGLLVLEGLAPKPSRPSRARPIHPSSSPHGSTLPHSSFLRTASLASPMGLTPWLDTLFSRPIGSAARKSSRERLA